MRIYAVTPLHVGAAEIARRADRYQRISPAGIEVHLHDLPPAAPRSLETADDVAASESFVQQALFAAPADYDALLADCVLDPAIEVLQTKVDRPVIGIMKVNLAYTAALGQRTAAVVRNQVIAEEFRRVAAIYGAERLTDVGVLDLDFDAIADGALWQQRLEELTMQLAAGGAHSVFNGCSAVDTDTSRPTAVPVYDPVARALRIVAAGGLW